jgi:hypothetical protein
MTDHMTTNNDMSYVISFTVFVELVEDDTRRGQRKRWERGSYATFQAITRSLGCDPNS